MNQVFLIMMLGAGLDAPIVDAFDEELVRIPKVIESRDDSTPVNKLYMDLYDAYVVGEGFDSSGVDMNDPKLSDIVKTVQVLEDKTLYAHGYLRL